MSTVVVIHNYERCSIAFRPTGSRLDEHVCSSGELRSSPPEVEGADVAGAGISVAGMVLHVQDEVRSSAVSFLTIHALQYSTLPLLCFPYLTLPFAGSRNFWTQQWQATNAMQVARAGCIQGMWTCMYMYMYMNNDISRLSEPVSSMASTMRPSRTTRIRQ